MWYHTVSAVGKTNCMVFMTNTCLTFQSYKTAVHTLNVPETCIVFGCTAVAKERAVTLHHFSKDRNLLQAWVRFVNRTRVWSGPTDTSTTCSQHFTPQDFESLQKFKMGFAKSLKLKSTAVSTIYLSTPSASTSTSTSASASASLSASPHASGGTFHTPLSSAPRPAARKRRLHRVR